MTATGAVSVDNTSLLSATITLTPELSTGLTECVTAAGVTALASTSMSSCTASLGREGHLF